jgi:hypothetical protein
VLAPLGVRPCLCKDAGATDTMTNAGVAEDSDDPDQSKDSEDSEDSSKDSDDPDHSKDSEDSS